jgi:hypothetical protein
VTGDVVTKGGRMNYIKVFLILSLTMILAISGCGREAPEETRELQKFEQEDIFIKEFPAEPRPPRPIDDVKQPLIMPEPPVVEPGEDIVLQKGEILVADFEGWPNNLGGEMGVYGALEPDWEKVNLYPYSWVYEPIAQGYDPSNVHSGNNSFRLVNALGTKQDLVWGSFAMDLGPTIDLTVVPKKVESLDVSGYRYLTFWAKGEKGGEKMEFLIRDAHALNYNPQVKYKLPDLTSEWQKIVIALEEVSGKVDLTQFDNMGIGFGRDVGNMQGDVAYIDDFVFTNSP